MPKMTLPPQDVLQRRLRAARVLADLTLAELAARVHPDAGLGERVLRNMEGGHTRIKSPALRELAVALGVPYAWFTVPDLGAALGEDPAAEQAERIAALEARFEQFLRDALERNSADRSQPHATESEPSAPRRGPRGTRRARGQ